MTGAPEYYDTGVPLYYDTRLRRRYGNDTGAYKKRE